MGISNKQNLAGSSTVYKKMFDEVFLGTNDPTNENYKLYSDVQTITGETYEYHFLNDFPEPRKWLGQKEFKAVMAHSYTMSVEDYEASTSVTKVQWLQNPEGVGSTLRKWLTNVGGFINGLVVAELLKGDTELSFDNVSMFNSAHPNGPNGGTQGNTSTITFSQAQYRAAKAQMRGLKGPSGRSLGLRPDLLIVGPAKEDLARDVIQAKDRVAAVSAGGVESGTRVAAASIENVVSGDGIRLIVDPRLAGGSDGSGADTSNYYFLIDSRFTPMVVAVAEGVSPADDTNEFHNADASYHFSLEAQLAIGYGMWFGVYAGRATS